jgi:hypothetical protein
MDSVEPAPTTTPREQHQYLTPAVRAMFSSELVEHAKYRAVGDGFGAMFGAIVVGGLIVENVFGKNQTMAGVVFLLSCVIGLVAYISERRSKIADIAQHDDQMVQVLYDDLKRRRATRSIIFTILVGCGLIAATIVFVGTK